MKLYLSSYQIGNKSDDLKKMVQGQRRIGVIRNALDFSSDIKRLEKGKEEEFNELKKLGLDPIEIDLRNYFEEKQGSLNDLIKSLDGLWVVGGNAFILRRAMKKSGLDKILLNLVDNESFVYAGYSAGACITTPTLKGINIIDKPDIVPVGYDKNIIWDGLDLIPFNIVPHYKSDHPESEIATEIVDFFIANKIPFIALSDGDVYIK